MAYWRRAQVNFLVATIMLIGGFIGTVIGGFFFQFIRLIGQIDIIISLLYILLLGTIGSIMLFESLVSSVKKKTMRQEFNRMKSPTLISKLPYKMRFPRSKLYVSALVPGGIGMFSGFLVSTMGGGGGFLLVPAMLRFYVLLIRFMLQAGVMSRSL